MSCGKPHRTDCATALQRLYEFLDGELDHATQDDIREHLEECGPCLREYDFDRIAKALVRRSCVCSAPEQLHGTVVAKLRATAITVRLPAQPLTEQD